MDEAKKVVDFFIAGAPKCGASALVFALRQNTEVVFSSRKEPHYFSTDIFYPQPKPQSNEEYIDTYFPAIKNENEVWGDGSVWHLFSTVALKKIKLFNPFARIVVILRDPAKAAFSLHQMRIFQNHEKIKDFQEAWSLSQERFDRIGFNGFTKDIHSDPRTMAYRQAVTFHPQPERLYKEFPDNQVLIIRQEDLASDGFEVVNKVSRFIGVEPTRYVVPSKKNKNFYTENKLLLDIARSNYVKKTAESIKKLLRIESFNIGKPSQKSTVEDIELVHRDLAEDIEAVKRDFGINLISKNIS